MTRLHAATTSAAFALIALALSGCTSAPIPPEPEPTSTQEAFSIDQGLLSFTRPTNGIGMTALLDGPLSLDTGCVGIGDYTLSFPAGMAEWDGSTLTIGSSTYQIGDNLAVGGGESAGNPILQEISDECGDELWIVSGPA